MLHDQVLERTVFLLFTTTFGEVTQTNLNLLILFMFRSTSFNLQP